MNDTWILNAAPAGDIILLYAVIEEHSTGSYSFHPAFCLYHDYRQKILHELREFKPELEKKDNSYLNPAGS